MKNKRQGMILEIITQQDIETQNQLMEELEARGVHSTQATLSRDIKQLRLLKELSPKGSYRYVPANRSEFGGDADRLRTIFQKSVTSVSVAQNLIVIKTLPGLANAACSTLDAMEIPALVGSLAGDDTAFLAMKDNESAHRLCDAIEEML